MFLGIAARASRNITSCGYGPRLEAGATRVFVAMTARNTSALAARGARGLRELSRLERGRGECRMRAAPAVSRAMLLGKTHTSIQVQRRRSDIPCAMVLRLITRSPRRRIRLVTVIGELTASPHPVGPTCLRQLDTSNGCRNHTTSPYASAPFVCTPFDRSRVWLNPKPALQFTCAPDAAASTASRPASMTMANAPLWGGTARYIFLSRVRRNRNIFAKGAVDREFTDLPVGQITGFERAPTEDIPDAEIRTSPWAKSLLREFPADRAF